MISFKSFKFGFEVNIYNLSMENYKDGNKDSNEGMEENKR